MGTNKDDSRIEIKAADVRVLISNIEAKDTPVPTNPKLCNKTRFEPARRLLRSRYIGLLLGPLYGAMLYYYITHMLLSGLPVVRSASAVNVAVASLSSNGSSVQGADGTVGQVAGCGTGVALAVGGCYSRRTRAAMLLMIPSLMSGRGRAFMISAAMGLLLQGPVTTIDTNVQQVVDSLTCLYESVKSIADQYVEQFREVMGQVNDLTEQVNAMVQEYTRQLEKVVSSATGDIKRQVLAAKAEAEKQARKFTEATSGVRTFFNGVGAIGKGVCYIFFCEFPDILPEFHLNMPKVNLDSLENFVKQLPPDINLADFDVSWEDIAGEIDAKSIAAIREKLKNILKSFFNYIRGYCQYASKIFYLSMFLMIVDAIMYLQNYYSDDSFDNMFVDDNLRRLWWTGGKEKLLPLRNWELNEKYQYSTALKLSKAEAKRIIIRSIPTMLFLLIAVCILFSDFAISAVLQVFRKEAQFGIAFKGMEQGVTFQSLLPGLKSGEINFLTLGVKGFNLTSDECLPTPVFTDHMQTGLIGAIAVVCLLSCIFDAYASRLRANICNLCFSVRAAERAEYLYKRIQTGRRSRRIQLHMVVSRELARRDRLAEFWRRAPRTAGKCPACYRAMGHSGKPFSATVNNVKRETHICGDCYKDVN